MLGLIISYLSVFYLYFIYVYITIYLYLSCNNLFSVEFNIELFIEHAKEFLIFIFQRESIDNILISKGRLGFVKELRTFRLRCACNKYSNPHIC